MFPGGCFFASVAAEVDTRPGPVRDRAMTIVSDWFGHVRRAIVDAQEEGAVDGGEDPDQLAFEINSYLLLANAQFVASGDPGALDRARRAVDRRLELAAPRTPARRRAAAR